MFQEIIVGLIGIIVASLVIYKIYGFFFSKNEQKGSCGCSSCGCGTKDKQVSIERFK
jgi:hypothetical protein